MRPRSPATEVMTARTPGPAPRTRPARCSASTAGLTKLVASIRRGGPVGFERRLVGQRAVGDQRHVEAAEGAPCAARTSASRSARARSPAQVATCWRRRAPSGRGRRRRSPRRRGRPGTGWRPARPSRRATGDRDAGSGAEDRDRGRRLTPALREVMARPRGGVARRPGARRPTRRPDRRCAQEASSAGMAAPRRCETHPRVLRPGRRGRRRRAIASSRSRSASVVGPRFAEVERQRGAGIGKDSRPGERRSPKVFSTASNEPSPAPATGRSSLGHGVARARRAAARTGTGRSRACRRAGSSRAIRVERVEDAARRTRRAGAPALPPSRGGRRC